MNEAAEVPVLAEILTAALLIAGAAITLIGSVGLIRLKTFYQRVHAPTLGTTLGMTCIATASMIYFSTLGTRPVLHELLIIVFVTVTTPITLMILVRAAVFRDDVENKGTSSRRVENGHR
jgi:multicomponent K+:H+ antiporter subunit G